MTPASFENVNLEATSGRGIAVVNLVGRNAPAVAQQAIAEQTIALVLTVTRDITRAERGIRAGGWPSDN